MFLSVGQDIKFHSVCKNGELENVVVDYRASNRNIIGVSISNDNTYVALLHEGEDPQILYIKSKFGPQLIHIIPAKNITALVFKRTTTRYLALGTEDGAVLNYDMKDKTATHLQRSLGNIRGLDYTSDDGYLCGIVRDVLFYFTEETNIQKFRQRSECTCLRCHHKKPDQAVLGLRDGSVIVWKLTSGEPLLKLDLFSSPVSGVTMSSCGTFLSAIADKVKICFLDVEESRCNFQHVLPQEFSVTAMDVRCDDKYLVVGLKDGTVNVYDMQILTEPVYTEKLHDGPVRKILFENKTHDSHSYATSTIRLSVENESEVGEIEKSATVFERESVATTSKVMDRKSGADKLKDGENELRDDELYEELTKLKDRLFGFLKTEMDRLEAKFDQQCSQLQEFMDNEFANIDSLMKTTFENQEEVLKRLFGRERKKRERKY